MVRESLIADAAHDMNGVRRRHATEADQLRGQVAGLERENAMLRDGRTALIEAYMGATGRTMPEAHDAA